MLLLSFVSLVLFFVALPAFLAQTGFRQINLSRSGVGHFHAAGSARALLAMDLSHVNQSLALKGEAPVDAILGADVFEAQAAVIDYGSSSLFLQV